MAHLAGSMADFRSWEAITRRHQDMPPAALGELPLFSHANELSRPLARSAAVALLLMFMVLALAFGAVPHSLQRVALTLRQDGSLGIVIASLLPTIGALLVTLGLVRAREATLRAANRGAPPPRQSHR